jgi:hypothetical protein
VSKLRRLLDELNQRPAGRDWRDDPEFLATLEAIGGKGYLDRHVTKSSETVAYEADLCAPCPRCGRTTLVIDGQRGARKKVFDFCECRFDQAEQIRRMQIQQFYDQQELAKQEKALEEQQKKVDRTQLESVLKTAAVKCKEQNLRDFGKCMNPTQRYDECKFCDLYKANVKKAAQAKAWANKRKADRREETA